MLAAKPFGCRGRQHKNMTLGNINQQLAAVSQSKVRWSGDWIGDRSLSWVRGIMANQRALERLGELSGKHLAVATWGFSPPSVLLPQGFLEKRSWWSGTTHEFPRFITGPDENTVDFGASANAAYQWLDQQGPRGRVCAAIVDGYFRRDEERRESLIQRMISVKDRMSTEVFFPYHLSEDGMILFADPICFVYDIAPRKQPMLAEVDIGAFVDAIKQGFKASGPMLADIQLWGYD
ncbi:MAG: hypothetical protein J0I31_13440 [Rhizobiales bacterium]|uniref:hypothetical protein n=1 Tax=Xanthobacter flavus TaxID=281 RepID=UPI001AD3A036|nr:hypothetical protein [Hyphomicrobiales bacterium]